MKAIILAAGIGSRFNKMTETTPKCLIKIGEKTILENQIEILKSQGIDDILVVIGNQGDCWTKENHERLEAIHNSPVTPHEIMMDADKMLVPVVGTARQNATADLMLDMCR